MNDDVNKPESHDDHSSKDDMQADCDWLEDLRVQHSSVYSEPFWMQDVRIAQRKIERQRASGPTPE